MKHCYDLLHELPPKLANGDWVWLNIHNGYSIPKGLLPPNHCIGIQHIGPYRIRCVVSNLAYKLELLLRSRLHPVISIQHLEPYVPTGMPVQTHKVTEILGERDTHRRGCQYLIRIVHAGHDQWVPVATVTDDTVLQAWRDWQAIIA